MVWIIPGMSGPLMLGNNYRDLHAEDPDTQRCSIATHQCIACTHRGPNFTTGKTHQKESLFNKDVLIQQRRLTNHRYYTHLFSLECLNTGFTMARFVNMDNLSVSETVNKVATEFWIYSEYGVEFGKPENAYIYTKRGDDLHSSRKAGEPEGLVWEESDFEPHFPFSEFLGCKYVHRDTNLQARLSEQVLVQNNTMWKGLGFTPHQMVLGLSSGVPGIYDIPEDKNNTNFARSLNRIKEGINKKQVASTRPHLTLGGSFPYQPGDTVCFLGSKGRIGLGCIAEVCNSKYRIIHSGTRSPILASDYISPKEKSKEKTCKMCSP